MAPRALVSPYGRILGEVDILLGVLLGVVLTASAVALRRLASPRRVLAPGEEGVRSALHAAAATLPHLRRGLTRESARRSGTCMRSRRPRA